MAVMRDRPYGNSNFLVDFGVGDARSVTAGFAEVIFPPFTVDPADRRQPEAKEPQGAESTDAPVGNRLILKRGLIGTLDLYAWWKEARQGKAPQRRTVKIELLSEDHSTVVLAWYFQNVRPVSLSYSPLRAVEGGIVMETVELAFDSVEMS
jgi:phage tail-like protein